MLENISLFELLFPVDSKTKMSKGLHIHDSTQRCILKPAVQ